MQRFKLFIFSLFIASSAYGGIGTPFILTDIKEVYPVVEVYVKNTSPAMKKEVQEAVAIRLKKLKIKTEGFSRRAFGILIMRVPVGTKAQLVYKTVLMIGEELLRPNGDELFAVVYENSDIYEPDMDYIEDSVVESVEYLLDAFEEQYIEDN